MVTSLWTTWQPTLQGSPASSPERWLERPFLRSLILPEAHETPFPPFSSPSLASTHRCPELVLLHITGVREQSERPPHTPQTCRLRLGGWLGAGCCHQSALATPGVVGHPSWSPQACETRGGSPVSQTRKPVLGGPGLQRCQEASGDTGPHVYPEGDLWTAGPAGPQVPRTHPTQVSADAWPRRHTPEEAREEGSARGALWTQNGKCLLLLLRPEPFE